MAEIDVAALEPVGEFGSLAWCEACAKYGVQLLEEGDGAPAECRALPGFHVELPWAAICNQSRSKYGREGGRQRAADEKVMYAAIESHVGRPNPLNLAPRKPAVWPPAVSAALSKNAEQGGGLHNIAASLQAPSPEFTTLPTTELGVPNFAAMTTAQKAAFLRLLAVDGY